MVMAIEIIYILSVYAVAICGSSYYALKFMNDLRK